MKHDDPTLTALQASLKEALNARDSQAESVARVNIACVYLQAESDQALPAFEAALAAVRRAQNTRSEGILSMVFAPYFVDKGDPARALELAQRGEQIARNGRTGHRVLSLIQLARVLYTGFADPDRAGEAVDLALAVLDESSITNPTDQQVVIQAAAHAALAATHAGDHERALALTRVVDPATADRLEEMRTRPVAPISATARQEITDLYAQWRARFAVGNTPGRRVAEMTRKTNELLQWDRVRSRKAGTSGNNEAVRELIQRILDVASGRQTIADAMAGDPLPLPLTDDDFVFVLALATDDGFNAMLPGWVVFELVGDGVTDPALKGRCLRLAAAVGHDQRHPRELLALLQRADAALVGGADDALRAEVSNEIAVCHLNLREPELALKAAKRAVEMTGKSGNHGLGRMALGNVANTLLQLGRVPEALAIFETLFRDQVAAGERAMADITRQNIEACRSHLKRVAAAP